MLSVVLRQHNTLNIMDYHKESSLHKKMHHIIGYCGFGAETLVPARHIENLEGEQGVGPRLGAP